MNGKTIDKLVAGHIAEYNKVARMTADCARNYFGRTIDGCARNNMSLSGHLAR